MSFVLRAACCLIVCVVSPIAVTAEQTEVSIKALDPQGKVLERIRFTFAGIESLPTNTTGVTSLQVPPLEEGQSIRLDLPTSLTEQWVLVDSMVHAPASLAQGPAEVVLIRRSELRLLAGEARDAAGQAGRGGEPINETERRQILIDYAAEYGLTEEELSAAIVAFGQTEDPMDRGIAEYLSGEYEQAEASLIEAAEAQEADFLETLRYLGATQYAQGEYRAAVETFRKAVAISSSDLALLFWLGTSLQRVALWSECEETKRLVLELAIGRYGETHPRAASAMNNLALLLHSTNRSSEAESLMRRALAIDQSSYGEDHPEVATGLNNLAQLLLATNRLSEAEPLMRRALAIVQSSYGEDHPRVATELNNLATLLHSTNRMSEAEPLMRRALAILQSSYGEDHPEVAIGLNNLAQLLHLTNRLSEAEPLMRRALAIDEASYGDDHPRVATGLNNLAQLLNATNGLSDAEPLMRRALAIFDSSLGHDHPNTRTVRNNLEALLAEKADE